MMKKLVIGLSLIALTFSIAPNQGEAQEGVTDDFKCYAKKVGLSLKALTNSFRNVSEITDSMDSMNKWKKIALISGRLEQAAKTAELIEPPYDADRFHETYVSITDNYKEAAEHFNRAAMNRDRQSLRRGINDFERGNRQIEKMKEALNQETTM